MDEEDEERLDNMPDLLREKEILERKRKRDVLLLRYQFLQRQKLKQLQMKQ